MKVDLVKLEYENGLKVDGVEVGTRGLRAHLMLSPETDEEAHRTGVLHLHIEAQPRILPAMTPDQTVEWLCQELVAALQRSP